MQKFVPPNLFGKPLDEVSTSDVQEFCKKQIKEGVNLDYKKDLSSTKSIVKAIASMGNTRGGWLIVGVDDKNELPVLPANGMGFEEHLELSVTNMVLSHMSSPLFPIIHVCPHDKDNKTFMIMYIPESNDGPHWLFNKKELYVRVEQRTSSGDWERFATSDEWEWLRKKREKSIELRKNVKEELNSYYLEYLDKNKLENSLKKSGSSPLHLPSINIESSRFIPRDGTEDMLNLYISPTFPQETVLTIEETYNKLAEIAIPDVYGTSDRFPIFLENRTVYQKGTIAYSEYEDDKKNRAFFTALDVLGMLAYKENVTIKARMDEEDVVPKQYISFDQLVIRTEEFIEIAAKLYNSTNYPGLLTMDIYLDADSWVRMYFPSQDFDEKVCENATGKFNWSKTFLVGDIQEIKDREDLLKEIVESLMFSFGWKDFNWIFFQNTIKKFHAM